jgi:hypothetical protein
MTDLLASFQPKRPLSALTPVKAAIARVAHR